MSNSCFIQYSVIYGRQGYKNKFLQVWLTASSAYLHIHRQYLQLVPNMQTKFKYLKNMHKLQLLQYKMMNCQYLYKSKLCWSQHQVPTSINAAIKFTLCQCWGSRFSWLPVFKCWSLYLGPYPNPYPPLKSWQFFLNFSFSSFRSPWGFTRPTSSWSPWPASQFCWKIPATPSDLRNLQSLGSKLGRLSQSLKAYSRLA